MKVGTPEFNDYVESVKAMTLDELTEGILQALCEYELGNISQSDLEVICIAIEARDGREIDDNVWDAYGWLQNYYSLLGESEEDYS